MFFTSSSSLATDFQVAGSFLPSCSMVRYFSFFAANSCTRRSNWAAFSLHLCSLPNCASCEPASTLLICLFKLFLSLKMTPSSGILHRHLGFASRLFCRWVVAPSHSCIKSRSWPKVTPLFLNFSITCFILQVPGELLPCKSRDTDWKRCSKEC